jgi:uncharacterized protein YbjT (DUF2867 family)
MTVVIFGATGRTGTRAVEYALNDQHEVVAFVRNKDKLALRHDNLVIVEGDIYDAQAVERALRRGYRRRWDISKQTEHAGSG